MTGAAAFLVFIGLTLLQGTPEKLHFPVPSGLRPPVAPELALQGLPRFPQAF